MTYQKLLYQSFLWRGLYFVSTFLVNILVARYYQAAFSGWIYYLTNLYAFVVLLSSASLESGICFYASKKEISVASLFNFSLVWVGIVAGAIFLAYPFIDSTKFSALPDSLVLLSAMCYICGILATNFFSNIFYGRQDFLTPNLVCTACNLFLILYLILALLFPSTWINPENLLFVYFLIFLAQGILLAVCVAVAYNREWSFLWPDKSQVSKLVKYAAVAFVSNILFFLMYRVDYYFVQKYCSPEQLGNYIQVSKIGQVLITIPSILGSAVFSLTAGEEQSTMHENLALLSRVLIITSGILCIVPVFAGEWIFPFVFGQTFDSMYLPFVLLIPGILGLSALYPLTAYYAGRNRISVNIRGCVVGLAVIICGDLLFIPRFGAAGAAIVSSMGYLTYYLFVLRTFRTDYPVTMTEFFMVTRSDLQWIKGFLLNRIR